MERLDVIEQVTCCTRCPLVDQCQAPVAFTGKSPARVAVVGEAPGGEEDKQGKSFIGPAGQWLRKRMTEVGIDHDTLAYMNVVSCVTGDSLIAGPSRSWASRRWYVGQIVTVRTALGHELTVTPNHPVLSHRGWIAAGQLVPFQDGVCSSLGQEVRLGDPYIEHPPIPAEEVFGALAKAGVPQRVVASNVNFHGDGVGGEVEVVSFDRNLGMQDKAARCRPVREKKFALTGDSRSIAGVEGSLSHPVPDLIFRDATFFGCSMSRCNHGVDLELTHVVEPQFEGFPSGSEGNTGAVQVLANGRRADAPFSSEMLQTFASLVATDQVVEVRQHQFSGWVYNFSTEGGWYSSNGIIVHNCFPHGTPTAEHVERCSPNRVVQLDYLSPEWILLVGGVALSAWRPDIKVSQVHGRPLLVDGRVAFSCYHPSAAMRRTSYDRELRSDLARFREMIDKGKSVWWKFIPEGCTVIKCENAAIWLDDNALGWCEKHMPLEGQAHLVQVDNEYRQLSGKPLISAPAIPNGWITDSAGGRWKTKCTCAHHPMKGHEAAPMYTATEATALIVAPEGQEEHEAVQMHDGTSHGEE